MVSLGGRYLLAAEILAGRRVTIRIEENTLMFFDPDTRELLRTRPNPLTWPKRRCCAAPVPPGRLLCLAQSPITVQRRANAFGVIMVAGRRSPWAATTPARSSPCTSATRSPSTWARRPRTVRRTTRQPVRSHKAHRPRKADHVS